MIKLILTGLILIAMTISCARKVNMEEEKQMLVKVLQQERKAHFDKDIDLFLGTFADSIVSVYNGKVEINTHDETKSRFTPYFKSVEFIKWDDVIEPMIDISDDGTMGYVVIKKTIVLTYPDTLGNPLIDSANYAWVSIYRKLQGEWKVVCNASTYEP